MNHSTYRKQRKMLMLVACLMFASSCCSVEAGEWMFRLKDSHLQLRQALFDRNAEAAWEHVDRKTRQDAGLLAAHVRRTFDSLSVGKKQVLREQLGITDDRKIQAMQGKDLLIAKFFLDAHPYLLTGERDDVKLKDHGTRMAGPTAIVLRRETPEEIVIPYTFTVEGHFGGQAMDYRASLTVPSLEKILGPAPPPPALALEDIASQSIAVFTQARKAFANGDVQTLWPLLDCESQSQASHFADQARQRFERHPEVAKWLQISADEIATLNGEQVWQLEWAQQDLAAFASASEPTYLDTSAYDSDLVLLPTAYKRRGGRTSPEQVVQFEADGRSWQIPVRVNYRNGIPEMKLVLRPPFYHRLRPKK